LKNERLRSVSLPAIAKTGKGNFLSSHLNVLEGLVTSLKNKEQ